MNMKLVDSHIHLYSAEYLDKLDDIIREAIKEGVETILCVAEDYETGEATLELSRKYDVVYPALGMHPWTAINNYGDLDKVVRQIEENIGEIIAIGEVGLDKKYESGEKGWARQLNVFRKMIELAEKYNKPLNIHSRRAAKDVLEILRIYKVEKAHFHWFTDDENILREIITEGYYVSFTPSITYSKRMQRMAKQVPISQILTETDGPVSFYGILKGKLTKPIHTKLVLQKLSEIHGYPPDEMAEIIYNNFKNLYGIK